MDTFMQIDLKSQMKWDKMKDHLIVTDIKTNGLVVCDQQYQQLQSTFGL